MCRFCRESGHLIQILSHLRKEFNSCYMSPVLLTEKKKARKIIPIFISNPANKTSSWVHRKSRDQLLGGKAFLLSGYTFHVIYASFIGTLRVWEQRTLTLLPFSDLSVEIVLHLFMCLCVHCFVYLPLNFLYEATE